MVRYTRKTATMIVAGVGVLMISCATPQTPPAQQQTNLPIEEKWQSGQASESRLVDDGWLSNFQDRRLSELVEEALRNNRDLQGGAAVVAEAEARARRAGADLRPTVDLAADAARSDVGTSSSASSQYNLGLQVSWEVDLWDRLGSESRAQALDAVAAAADFEFARQSLAARVAESWFVTIGNKLQLGLDEDVLAIESDTLDVVQLRVDAGAVSRVDLNVARAGVARAKESVARSQGNLEEAVRSLEVLLGRYPSAELDVIDQLTSYPEPIPAGLPSELLERRPDLVARDRQVAAAFNRTQAAKAARLPRLALTGAVGGASGSLRDVLNPSNVAWSLGTNLLAPLYDGGRLQADVDITTAQQEQALAAYASTALQAFEEVETALANERVLLVREERLTIVVDELADAVRILELRYNAGEIDLLSLNQVKKNYFTARDDLLRVQVERLRQRVNLHLALGGSFEARPPS